LVLIKLFIDLYLPYTVGEGNKDVNWPSYLWWKSTIALWKSFIWSVSKCTETLQGKVNEKDFCFVAWVFVWFI